MYFALRITYRIVSIIFLCRAIYFSRKFNEIDTLVRTLAVYFSRFVTSLSSTGWICNNIDASFYNVGGYTKKYIFYNACILDVALRSCTRVTKTSVKTVIVRFGLLYLNKANRHNHTISTKKSLKMIAKSETSRSYDEKEQQQMLLNTLSLMNIHQFQEIGN
ncbi:hypothetical protein BDC45DRAFT_530289 [Circinella umbellata]|nr:hypothetical protein BDC45DRAFT_530289 [Circinella umbellata]